MKKIVLFTIFQGVNYGSVFQTYATKLIMEKNGFDCDVINYMPESKQFKTIIKSTKNTSKGIKKIAFKFLKLASFIIRYSSFRNFRRNIIKIGYKKYRSYQDVIDYPIDADIFMVGSDQVWNSFYNEGVDKGYFLAFENAKVKIAFVSSFGNEKISQDELALIKPLLQEFKAISVREDSALEILRDCQINGKLLIDPTLQISKIEWKNIASKALLKKKYVLLFIIYGEDNGATDVARKIANEKGCILVKLCWDLVRDKRVDKIFTHRKPEDFLSLFLHAEFVVTNSFHGTAFSINFNKQFIVVEREKFNTRIDSLLRLTGTLDRKIKINSYDHVSGKNEIDYEIINEILASEREKTNKFIKENINE